MAQAMQALVRRIRTMAGLPGTRELSDRQLLERFTAGEQSAFAALVQRHGALVLGVCRRVLQNAHDAEDAFQATFLVLARKASSVGWKDSIGNWLHGVAYRIAMKARTGEIRRRLREQKAAVENSQEKSADINWSDLRRVLDQELARLPARYRAPLLLCYLEGKTRDEAAQELGWSAGSVKGRLERGRELLRERLARRGLALSAVLCASLLPESAASAAIPASLAATAVQAGMQFITGQAAGVVSAQVLSLTQGALHAMLWTKIKITTALILTIGALGIGGAITHQTMASSSGPAAASPTFASDSFNDGLVNPILAFQDAPKERAKESPEVRGQIKRGDVKLYLLQPGRILFVAREGQIVKKGDIILSVDKTLANLKLRQTEASLQEARIRLAEAQKKQTKHAIDEEMQKAATAIATGKLKDAKNEFEKRKKLFQDKLINKKDLEVFQELFNGLESLVNVEKTKLKLLKQVDPLVDASRAQRDVDAKEAIKRTADLALKESDIHAPFDGKILRVFVQAGEILGRDPKVPVIHFGPRERGKEIPQVQGEVREIDAGKGTITLVIAGGRAERKTFNLASKDIKVATNFGEKARLADLKEGMWLTLGLSADMDVIGISIDAPMATGTLNVIKHENKKNIINVGTGRGIGLWLHLDPEAKFSLDGQACKFTDIKTGMRVTVYMTLDRKTVLALRAGEDRGRRDKGDDDGRERRRQNADVAGVIVGIHKTSIDVLVGTDDLKIETFELAKDFVIQGQGQEPSAGKLSDLVKAIRVRLKLSEDKKTVTRIDVAYPVLRGAITAIDAGKNTITIGMPRGQDKTLPLAKEVKITVDGRAGAIAGLKERMQAVVTLSLDRSQVTAIAVGGGRPAERR